MIFRDCGKFHERLSAVLAGVLYLFLLLGGMSTIRLAVVVVVVVVYTNE